LYFVKNLIVCSKILYIIIVKEVQKRSEEIDINNFIIFENFVKNSNNTKIINILLKENLQNLLFPKISIDSLKYLYLYTVRLIYLILNRIYRFDFRNITV